MERRPGPKLNFEQRESIPKDVSTEFLSMGARDFSNFLRTQKEQDALSIKINWVDVMTARRVKAFLEDRVTCPDQKRFATIRATKEQKMQEPNVFSSGVEWEEIFT